MSGAVLLDNDRQLERVPGQPFLPRRLLKMTDEALELLHSDPGAYEFFAEEERRKVADPETGWAYFMDNYASHVPASGGARQPLDMWDAQREIIVPEIHEHDQTIILKTRRYGATLIVLHYFAWLAGYAEHGYNQRLVAISNRLDNAGQLLRKTKDIFKYLNGVAPWLSCPIGSDSRDADGRPGLDQAKEFGIAHRGSSIAALPPNEAARSDTVSLLFLDEYARYRGAADPSVVLEAALPTIEGGGRAIIVSTAGEMPGKGDLFAKLYLAAEEGKNGMHPIFIPRSARPGRTDKWFEQQKINLGPVKAAREYPETVADALMPDPEGAAFDQEGVLDAWRLGAHFDKMLASGELTPKEDLVDLGVDWGDDGTGWCVGFDLARDFLFVCRADELHGVDAEMASREMVEEAEAFGKVYEEFYDPGGSGAQANRSFKRIFGHRIRRYKVSFSKNKRLNVEHLRMRFRRTKGLTFEDWKDGKGSGGIIISQKGAAIMKDQLLAAKSGSNGGLDKKTEGHALDSLICLISKRRKKWDLLHADKGDDVE